MSIEDLINNVVYQDFAKAGPTFQELMQDLKISRRAVYTSAFTPPTLEFEG